MNKEKVKKRILELEYQKNELEKAKIPIWIYITLWCIPFYRMAIYSSITNN